MSKVTIIKTVLFNASPETVWLYLTDKDKLGEWYHPAEADLEEGKAYALLEHREDGSRHRLIWGLVLEMTKPQRLVTTFIVEPFDGRETRLTWELDAVAGGTRLQLTHEGILEAAGEAGLHLLQALDKGWDEHFGEMRRVIGD